jgi:regulator of RNase E activity RraA
MSDTQADLAALARVTGATVTVVLLKEGLRNVGRRGGRARRAGQPSTAGRVFTRRLLPAREDLAISGWPASARSTRATVERMPPGSVAVVDPMDVPDAGVFGAILCARMRNRRVLGLLADRVARGAGGVLGTGLTFASRREPVAGGGVTVFPDDDDAVLDAAPGQERLEGCITSEMERGLPLPGLCPADAARRARDEASVHGR